MRQGVAHFSGPLTQVLARRSLILHQQSAFHELSELPTDMPALSIAVALWFHGGSGPRFAYPRACATWLLDFAFVSFSSSVF
jgi:hypothetical protein